MKKSEVVVSVILAAAVFFLCVLMASLLNPTIQGEAGGVSRSAQST